MEKTTFTVKRIILASFGVLLFILLVSFSGKLFEEVGAGEIVVIQDPIDGELHIYTSQGLKPQYFGTVTHYKKSFQFWFQKPTKENPDESDMSIKARFNDGGHAQLSGSVRVDLPLSDSLIISLHTRYGSQESIEKQLIATVITKAVYMTGSLMSSKESSSEKRNDLISYVEDQSANGVYKTFTTNERQKDPMDSTVTKTVTVVKLQKDALGNILRQEGSPISRFGIRMYNLSIASIDYDKSVEDQIATQQKSIMQVQTAIANAKRAEQDKFTVEQQGMADAAKAKWEQEVIKAKMVTQAQQQLAVQELNTKTAALYKQQQILEGEGEAEKKKLIMAANGALDVKLEAWLKSQEFMWDAFSKFSGNMVPLYQTGATGGTANAMEFMQIMGMKAAKDLNLDMSNKK